MWYRLTRWSVLAAVVASANVCRAQFTTVINVPSDPAPTSIGSDTQLNVLDGGVIADGFNAGLADGTTTNAEVNISGGIIGAFFNANPGSDVTVSGGNVGVGFDALGGSRVRVGGGTVSAGFNALLNSEVLFTSGTASELDAHVTSDVYIAGGAIGRANAHRESRVRLYGTEFLLDGTSVAFANFGQAVTIDDRGAELTGMLADGSAFNFELSSDRTVGSDFFDSDAELTVTLISQLEGDYNSNGTVEQADLDLVLLNWGDNLFNPYAAGWINDVPSGAIDQEELDNVLLNWGDTIAGPALGAAAGVPEPRTATLAAILLWFIAISTRRRFQTVGDCVPFS
jgi:hypothetical protein